MKKIELNITDEEWALFNDCARTFKTTCNKIMEQFIADLVCSENSGGSDERNLADSWVERSKYNFFKK